MKKWFEWQWENQCQSHDWAKWSVPVTNILPHIDWFIKEMTEKVESGEIPTWFEQVFHRKDWTQRTSATTDGAVSYDELKSWMDDAKYAHLRNNYGLTKVSDFSKEINDKMSKDLGDSLCLKEETVRFYVHNEKPGEMFPMHFDRNRWNMFGVDGKVVYDTSFRIFLVFLDDWQHGQVFQMGDKFIKWKKGDAFSWSHRDTPHGSANFGFEDRPAMIVTGYEKDAHTA